MIVYCYNFDNKKFDLNQLRAFKVLRHWRCGYSARNRRRCRCGKKRCEFLHISCKFPLSHTLLPYICLRSKLSHLNHLLKLLHIVGTSLLTIHCNRILNCWHRRRGIHGILHLLTHIVHHACHLTAHSTSHHHSGHHSGRVHSATTCIHIHRAHLTKI